MRSDAINLNMDNYLSSTKSPTPTGLKDSSRPQKFIIVMSYSKYCKYILLVDSSIREGGYGNERKKDRSRIPPRMSVPLRT